MKNLIALFTSLFLVFSTISSGAAGLTDARSIPEWEEASAFLSSKGIVPREVTVVYESPQCVYFAAPLDSAFVLVARRAYKDALPWSLVLAYGTGNEVWLKSRDEEDPVEQDGFFMGIIGLYESALKTTVSTSQRPLTQGRHLEIGPFCGDINYGQHLPFNRLFPKDGKGADAWYSVVGCGPVALAQVLTYHRSPVQPKGSYSGKTLSGNPYSYNLADYPVDWDALKPEVLLLDCAVSLGTRLGIGYSLTMLSQFKAALFDAWSYSPRCRLLTESMAEHEMLSLILEDLSARRPVILAGGHHIYVCDGASGEFLHFDFGWRGFGNGYFRTLVLPESPTWQLPFTEALIGIKPDGGTQYQDITVKISKAGTLEKKLPKNKLHLIRKLTVKGPLNGKDFDLIRKMAGAVTMPSDFTNPYGALTELDLTEAKIVATAPFHTLPPKTEIKGTITPTNAPAFDYCFKLDAISKDDWADIEKLGLDKTYGLERIDGVVLIKHATWDDTIPEQLFSGCLSLRRIALPKKLKKVGQFAFLNCKGLTEVKNLPKDVHPQAFFSSSLEQR